jgi:hypothetical protein
MLELPASRNKARDVSPVFALIILL